MAAPCPHCDGDHDATGWARAAPPLASVVVGYVQGREELAELMKTDPERGTPEGDRLLRSSRLPGLRAELSHRERPALENWAVYRNPLDYPGRFVVRRWVIVPGLPLQSDPEPLAVVDTLEAARAAIPPGLCCLPAWEDDDPVIVEVWL